MCIRLGNVYSPSFNVLMDDLNVSLSISNFGEQIGNIFRNLICYADDLSLISLSFADMQKLLNVCSKYAIDHS